MKPLLAWKIFLFVFLIILFIAVLPMALAQNHKQSAPKYDTTSEITVKGVVEEIKTPGTDDAKETHLVLRTDKGLVEICLCPAKFLSAMDMNFAKGDKLEVKGAKAKDAIDDSEVVLAREIVRGDTTMVLRDKTGGPVWTWMLKN